MFPSIVIEAFYRLLSVLINAYLCCGPILQTTFFISLLIAFAPYLLYSLFKDLVANNVSQIEQEHLRLKERAPDLGDHLSKYEMGLQAFNQSYVPDNEFLAFEQQLLEIIRRTRLHGDTRELLSRRNEIIFYLNQLCISKSGKSFNQWCETDSQYFENDDSNASDEEGK